jgi:hypothetical protein
LDTSNGVLRIERISLVQGDEFSCVEESEGVVRICACKHTTEKIIPSRNVRDGNTVLAVGCNEAIDAPVARVRILEDLGPNSSLAIRGSRRDIDQDYDAF